MRNCQFYLHQWFCVCCPHPPWFSGCDAKKLAPSPPNETSRRGRIVNLAKRLSRDCVAIPEVKALLRSPGWNGDSPVLPVHAGSKANHSCKMPLFPSQALMTLTCTICFGRKIPQRQNFLANLTISKASIAGLIAFLDAFSASTTNLTMFW